MLGSITPLGERSRGSRWPITVGFYVAGSILGGAALGAFLGSVGAPVVSVVDGAGSKLVITIISVAVLAGLIADFGTQGTRLPSVRRQVDDAWMTRYRGWAYGFGFGFQLGLGVVTVVTTSLVYLTFVAAFLSGSLGGGVLIGATFGAMRAVVIFLVARVHSPERLEAFVEKLRGWQPAAHRAALGMQAAVLIALLFTLM